MIEDARTLPDDSLIDADVCIIGAGAASISMALGLAGSSIQVCVVESGGLQFERKTQDLYKGAIIGLEYEPLDLCRVRGFGGSTGPKGWGGWAKPLSDIDFEPRPWVPLSGWPIDIETLQPYYHRAREALGFKGGTIEYPRPGTGLLEFRSNRLETEFCPLSPAPDLGLTGLPLIRAARNVRVLLHANVTEIVTNPAATRVIGVRSVTLEHKTIRVNAANVILAAGGLENARLLLASNRTQSEGLGNGSDFVGRCFMEHPRFAWGRLEGSGLAGNVWRYDPGTIVRQRSRGVDSGASIVGAGLAVSPAEQQREGLLNARSWIVPIAAAGESQGAQELKELIFWLKKRRVPGDTPRRIRRIAGNPGNAARAVAAHLRASVAEPKAYQFVTVMEQEPSRDSRVTLSDTVDPLGMRRIRLDWRLGALEAHTLRRNQAIICEELTARGLKCVVGRSPDEDSQRPPKWVWHHIGTTRMSADPRQGVVDADCRVHGIDNLYVAGSSVFPTGGNDMPTLTVVALAYRLADHIKAQHSRSHPRTHNIDLASGQVMRPKPRQEARASSSHSGREKEYS